MPVEDDTKAQRNAFHQDISIDATAELLKCPALASADSGVDKYRGLSERLGLDFSSIIDVFDHLPIFMDGREHAGIRAELAQIIALTQKDQALDQALEPVEKLNCAGTYDLVKDIIKPSVDGMFSDLVGVDLSALDITGIPLILNDTIGVRKRKTAEAQIIELSRALKKSFPDEPQKAITLRIALVVLGHDAMIGAVVLSLLDVLSKQGSARLSQIDFPDALPQTGVPFVRRKAVEEYQSGDIHIPKDHSVSLDLDLVNDDDKEDQRGLFFGSGRHLCLGRSIANLYWQKLLQKLGTVDRKLRILSGEEKTDTVFRIPAKAIIEVE